MASIPRAKYQREIFVATVSTLVPWGYNEVLSNHDPWRVAVGWLLWLIPLSIGIHVGWTWLRDNSKSLLSFPLALLIVVGFGYAAYKSISKASQVSFVFLIPGAVLNGDTWDFVVNHRGPEAVYDVDILFEDQDRFAQLRKKAPLQKV